MLSRCSTLAGVVALAVVGGGSFLPGGCGEKTAPKLGQEGVRTPMTIEEARQSWESKLMGIRGVTGVGIGLTRDRRAKCIKVYVDRTDRDVTDKIPKEIEGYPVEVEPRGSFRVQ